MTKIVPQDIQAANKLLQNIFLVFGVVFFLVGSAVSFWGFKAVAEANATEKWPQVEGKVTASETTSKRTRSRSGGTSKTSRKRKNSTSYRAGISYDYAVEDEAFTSDRFSFGSYGSSNREHADSIVAEFPAGKIVPVFYDPENPESAVLKTGGTFFTYLPILIGSIFVLVGGSIALKGFLRMRKS